jgi:glucosamine--fructose-6-phosphate aminotransferase (isomerizing)
MVFNDNFGSLMVQEIAEAPGTFRDCIRADCVADNVIDRLRNAAAFYTVARGSSDAVATILSYEFMRELRCPTTFLPPSIFSLNDGLHLEGAGVLVISQSGASEDLVRSARAARTHGALVCAITNVPDSAVERAADATLSVNAGIEHAVPATKTVIGSIAKGMNLLAKLSPAYAKSAEHAAREFPVDVCKTSFENLVSGLVQAQNIYVVGRGAGLGAAQEIALKLKECCALHAEAYSASEVLHGPLQLVIKPLTVLILDTEEKSTQDSLGRAEARFVQSGCNVYRLRPSKLGASDLTPAAAAALLIYALYPMIKEAAVALGYNPDVPNTLSKITVTV